MQVVPQPPQLARSVCVLTHCPPQSVLPDAQAQVPVAHVLPAGQALVHVPQYAALLFRSTHAPLQLVSPVPHEA
jgi:hypothetical protein